jgi:hypothetical protein
MFVQRPQLEEWERVGRSSPASNPGTIRGSSGLISQTSIDTLARLFPGTKLSVLQLVLQRCEQDLLKAIEYFSSDSERASAFHPPATQQTQLPKESMATSSTRQIAAEVPPLQIPLERSSESYALPPLYSAKLHADAQLVSFPHLSFLGISRILLYHLPALLN